MGWFSDNRIKSKSHLINLIKDEFGTNFINYVNKKDHIWFLYRAKDSKIVTAMCYLIDETNNDFFYKPIAIESGPNYYDIPKIWLDKITDVEERNKLYPDEDYSILGDWLNDFRLMNGLKIKGYDNKDNGKVTSYKGEIKELSHLIITDPHYENNVKCRYDKVFNNPEEWNVDLKIIRKNYYDVYCGHKLNIRGYDINILLTPQKNKEKNFIVELTDNGSIKYTKILKYKNFDIGMDTAQVSFGVNDKAKEIIDYKMNNKKLIGLDDYRPYFSIETLTDGLFGNVSEFKYLNEYYGINITGWVDDDTGYDEKKLKKYFEDRLEVQNLKEITKEEENNLVY